MNDDVKVLFQQYLQNSCTETDRRKLLEYFGAEGNEQLLKELIYRELEGEMGEEMDIADVDARLEAIYPRLAAHIDPPRVVRVNWRRIAVVAAAVIGVVISAGIFFWKPGKSTHDPVVQDPAQIIKPGRNQAILRLSDGREINLEDAADGQLAAQPGVRITKSEDGQLIYQADESADNDIISYNTIEAPAGGQWQVVLPDRSRVWLNARTSLRYPTRFRGNERKVELKGEAYFEVTPDKNMPFKVESKGQTVEVLGTHFNMMSYVDDAVEKTTLFEGAVKIAASGNTKMLEPGEQAQVGGNKINISINADLEEAIAWKNGYFKFNGGLEDIMNKISRWYDVEIVYINKPDPADTFEGEISRSKDLKEILRIMEYTGKVHFTIKERRIEVRN